MGLQHLLMRGVRFNQSLVHMDIGSNDVTCEGAIYLFKMIESHPSLTSLVVANHDRLHRNRMSVQACYALGDLLAKNQILTMLNIADNNINNEGIKAIASGFERAPTKELVSLNIAHNELEGVPAIESLGCLLDSTSSLQMLNLSENRIGDDGVELMAKSFNEGKCRLAKLILSNISATAVGFKALFTALRSNQYLLHLNIDGNDFKSPPRFTREQLLKQQNYYNYQVPHYSNPSLD